MSHPPQDEDPHEVLLSLVGCILLLLFVLIFYGIGALFGGFDLK